jgi:hypothetical protein
MVGYPIGLWDEVNNLPLIRRGITASHPAIDFRGRSECVIDAACFPGSSGSPVLIVNEGMVVSKKGMNVGSSRVIFLGVLHSGPILEADGTISVQEIPTQNTLASSTKVMIHLGYVIKAKELRVLGEHIKEVLKERGGAL